MLLENVWDYHFDPQTNVIDVHIRVCDLKSTKDLRNRCCIPCVARAI